MDSAGQAAEVPIRGEGAHYRVDVTSIQRGLVAADDITGVGLPGLEYGRPDVAPLVERPLAAVGAEHHRAVVGGFGDDRYPDAFIPVRSGPRWQPRAHELAGRELMRNGRWTIE